MLNLDTRGNTGPAVMLATNEDSGWVVDEFAKAAPYPMTTSMPSPPSGAPAPART